MTALWNLEGPSQGQQGSLQKVNCGLEMVPFSAPFLSKVAEQEMKPSFLLVPQTIGKDRELWEMLSTHRTVSWLLPDPGSPGHASLLLRALWTRSKEPVVKTVNF